MNLTICIDKTYAGANSSLLLINLPDSLRDGEAVPVLDPIPSKLRPNKRPFMR